MSEDMHVLLKRVFIARVVETIPFAVCAATIPAARNEEGSPRNGQVGKTASPVEELYRYHVQPKIFRTGSPVLGSNVLY